ncbi:hypothetical protein N7476_000348 [Penicillium atrosanguineum]|uniref:Uncharacterized protein n=1 Tax=Penicillium atrosanguineum TaxID=1132637 RepID=A0A9W9QBV5_9EURO|nr:hypothetical protein N7476_000348 [Penicillium atrosanguineum]
MESFQARIAAAIDYLTLLASEPWTALHVRQQDEHRVTLEAAGWKLDLSLDTMKSSIFGYAYLLDRGGYFWKMLLHALRHRGNPGWNPFSGSDGVRVGSSTKKGILYFCPVVCGEDCTSIPFTVLNSTLPGQLMIWQSENPDSHFTRRLKIALFLRLVTMACIGNGKYLWRGLLGLAILVLRCVLVVTMAADRLTRVLWCRSHAGSFQQLE